MKYLLDTNVCIYAIKRQPKKIADRLAAASVHSTVAVSAISVAELEYGASKSQNPPKNREALVKFLAPFLVTPFSEEAAAFYGALRAALEAKGKPIGGHDMLIAAQALAGGYTLITNNEREFSRIPDLPFENWT